MSGLDFLLWKSEYYDACNETTKRNIQAHNRWTFDALVREGRFDQNAQGLYDPELYAQIQVAALMAWRKLPAKGESGSSLSGIRQGPDEPFQEFVNLLLTTASRIFGNPEAGIDYVKQLAFENANSACQASIRPHL